MKKVKAKKIIVGNWKMYPALIGEAKDIFAKIKRNVSKISRVNIVICPPYVYINELRRMDLSGKIHLGAQDVFYEDRGAFTGEVSPLQVQSVGASYVILGHSERRAQGESDELIAKKLNSALKAGLNAILCIGESERDTKGDYLGFLENQIKNSLKGVNKKTLSGVVIAYEPVWAIGKSFKEAMNPPQFEETALFIRKVMADAFGREIGMTIPVLYGGSVTPVNAEALLSLGKADGFLVGRDSLSSKDFVEIVKIAEQI